MKIKYYGTASAEGVPALFCKCDVCLNAQNKKGKEIRSRTQNLIDDTLLIDFPGDTFLHKVRDGLPLNDIEHLIVTHSHADHFTGEELMMRKQGFSNKVDNKLNIYGNSTVKDRYIRAQSLVGYEDKERLKYNTIKPYTLYEIDDYHVVPLLADHAKNEDCYFYQIKKENKSLLFAQDTGYFPDSVWDYWKDNPPFFDLISLDCTHQKVKVSGNHMSFYDNIKIKQRMIGLDYADETTIFVITHFSHNGGLTHEEMEKWANEYDIITAYDGLEIKF